MGRPDLILLPLTVAIPFLSRWIQPHIPPKLLHPHQKISDADLTNGADTVQGPEGAKHGTLLLSRHACSPPPSLSPQGGGANTACSSLVCPDRWSALK